MKKLLWIVTILLTTFVLFSCEEVTESHYSAQEIIDALEVTYQEGDSIDHVTGSMIFPLTSSLDQKN